MKNKFQESIHANHIGFVISDILMTVGAVIFLVALTILADEEYSYGQQSSLLEMRRYGLALTIGGVISMITCALNIATKSVDTSSNNIVNNPPLNVNETLALVDTIQLGSPEHESKNSSDNQNAESNP